MDSLENLRKYVGSCRHSQVTTMPPINMVTVGVEKLTKLIDAVEEERDEEYAEAYDKGYDEGYDEGYASADAWYNDHENVLAEHGWYRVLDADGVPWHRGSRVIDPKDPDGKVNTVWIAGDNTLITDDHLFISNANKLHHYHEPTVEDVLTEMLVQAVGYSDAHTTVALSAIAEYAKKLQLRGDGE